MKVILKQDVEQVGKAGAVVDVAAGFFRNYLSPRGMALVASTRSVSQLDHGKRLVAAKLAREMKTAEAMKMRLEGTSIKIAREAGEEDKLFGSVTSRDVAEALAAEGVPIDHKRVDLEKPIKHIGIYHVDVKVAPEMIAKVKVWVVAK